MTAGGRDAEPVAGPRVLFGLRVSAVVEAAGFLAGLLLLAWLTGSDRFADVSPHPFWIVVLLVAANYGTNEGLMAAGLATAALLTGHLPPQALNETEAAWLLRISTEPVFWFLAAVVIGEIRAGHRRERDRLEEEMVRAREEAETIADAYDRLSRIKRELEVRVAAQPQTIASVYRASRLLDRATPAEVVDAAPAFVQEVLEPRKFSLFLHEDGALAMAFSAGWDADDTFAGRIDAESPLYRSIVCARDQVCVGTPAQEAILSGQGVLAGALVDPVSDAVFGMLKIESIRFADLNPATVTNFRVACDWIGEAYGRARAGEALRLSPDTDPETGLLSESAFAGRCVWLRDVAERASFPATCVYLAVDVAEETRALARSEVGRLLAVLDDPMLRRTDQRFVYRHNGWDYALMLPCIDRAGAELVGCRIASRLQTRLAEAGLAGRVSHAVGPLHRPTATTGVLSHVG